MSENTPEVEYSTGDVVLVMLVVSAVILVPVIAGWIYYFWFL